MANTITIVLFILALVITFFVSRIIVYAFPHQRALLVTKNAPKLNLHHAHWGSILVIIASLYMLFYNVNSISAIVLGVGISLCLDEIIPLLFLKTKREHELEVYHHALPHTLLLLILIVTAILVLLAMNL